MKTQRSVLIAPGHIPHYRSRFYELLCEQAKDAGIRLKIAASLEVPPNLIPGTAPGTINAPIYQFGPLAWQNTMVPSIGCDLVIAQQEAKYIANYVLQAKRLFSSQKFAFWGHGKNFQNSSAYSGGEIIKRYTALHCDWWFAYNAVSAAVVSKLGFPKERITVVNNSIDTGSLIKARGAISCETIKSTKECLGIHSSNIGIYTGGLYKEKRIPFLLNAAARIRAQLSDFHLIVIGAGPDSALISEAARCCTWIHYLGPKSDVDKLPYWAISKVCLMPGLVGLVVLDSFALGVPLVTTSYPHHSPEISYLINNVNGIVTDDWESPEAYARAVVALLSSESDRSQMAAMALKEAGKYTIEAMASNFAHGIKQALETPHLRRQ